VNKLRLIIPVYNDWISLGMLLRELDTTAATLPFQIFVSIIDDGSTEDPPPGFHDLSGLQHLVGVEIVTVSVNVGHQRAIAIGLCVAAQDHDADAVLIMDADGEDPPHSIQALTRNISGRTDFCFIAQSKKRVETLSFKAFYMLYKWFFQLVTGQSISFGNFCLLSRSYVDRLVMVSDLWNNLPAAIMRSQLPITLVPIRRGRRYAGKSKMNFSSLIVHGFSSMSVYADTIFVRLLLLSIGLFVSCFLLILAGFSLRLFSPTHATLDWTTTVAFSMIIILVQVLLTTISSILVLLNNRVQRLFIPLVDFHPYLAGRKLIFGRTLGEST
jgi:glycosyltransferase involved in cell wall biosynthesis